MSTGYHGEMQLDLDGFEEALADGAALDRHGRGGSERGVFGGGDAAADTDELLMESDGQTVPDSQALAKVFWRSVRTMAPIILADVLGLALAGLFAQGLLHWIHPEAVRNAGWAMPLALLPLIAAYWLNDLYSQIWVHPVIEFRQLTHVNTVGLMAAAAGGILAPPLPLWCLAAWPAAVALVPMLRTIARHVCVGRSWWGYPTLVIGSGEGAEIVAQVLLDAPRTALRPVLLTDPHNVCRTSVLPVVNDPATLESIIRAKHIRHAVISLPQLSSAHLGEALNRYSGLVPHVLVLSDSSTLPTLWGASRSSGRLSGIEVRNGLKLHTLQAIKRALDLAVSVVVIVVGAPILLAILAAARLTSPGPVFFGHTRIGKHGKLFKAWKFRTMRVDGDAVLREHLANSAEAREEWARDHKLRDDPRVTGFGKLLRKTSLDELPQIWNVLRGDMSLVGPRPIVEGEIWRYGQVFRLYTTVKPGITGMWQVSGRNDIGYDDRVVLDQFYIRHWSPWLDVYIMAKTVVALVNRDGAY
ncbi:MAG TPA: undecaprenyl-phosphate galactose phosphotransferase WbaP [Tepidisphaeraceae bacterium]